MPYRSVFISASFLLVFAVVGSGLVAFTFDSTEERIAENQRRALLKSLNELVPSDRYDNNMFSDILEVRNSELLGTDEPVPVYRARKGGWPIAAVLAPVAPDGYNGNIRLLVAVNLDGTLAGVRVVQHRETPGLGDKIEADKDDWINLFNGATALADPAAAEWNVRRDGGNIDQLSGATITSRAVLNAIRKTQRYYLTNAATITAPAATTTD